MVKVGVLFTVSLLVALLSACGSSEKPADQAALYESACKDPRYAQAYPGICTDKGSVAPAPATTTVAATPPTPPPASSQLSDKGWNVVDGSILLSDDGLGDFGGTLRLTNNTGGTQTAIVTLTAFQGESQVASLRGSAGEVAAGDTVTVDLVSTDSFVPGALNFDFQVDASFG